MRAIVRSSRGFIGVGALARRIGGRRALVVRELVRSGLVEGWDFRGGYRLTLSPLGAARLAVRLESSGGVWRWRPIGEPEPPRLTRALVGRRRDVASWSIDSRTGEVG